MKTIYEYDRDDLARLIAYDLENEGIFDVDDDGSLVFQFCLNDGKPSVHVFVKEGEECCGECGEDESGVDRALGGIVEAIVNARTKAEKAAAKKRGN